MPGTVFFETLRRTWKGTLGWAVGIAVMALYVVIAIPDAKVLQQYADIMKTAPKMLVLLAGSNADFATPAGIFSISFFSWIMLVLATYGVIVGLSITANEEERGIMDVLLSLPLARWRIVLEKFAAYTLNTVVIALVTFMTIRVSTLNSEIFKLDTGIIFWSCVNLIPAVLLCIAFTAFVASIVRRRGTVTAVAGGFVVVSYLLDTIGRSVSGDGLRALSFFSYFDGVNSLTKGVSLVNMGLLLAISLLLIGLATVFFERRDVGV